MEQIIAEIQEIFNENISPKIPEDTFFRFILGEGNRLLPIETINRIKNGNQRMNYDKLQMLAKSNDWHIDRWLEQLSKHKETPSYNTKSKTYEMKDDVMLQKIRELHLKYIGPYKDIESESELLKKLICLQFLKTPNFEDALVPTEVMKYENEIWKDKEKELAKIVRKNKITFVSGSAACGKRRIVEKYLSNLNIQEFIIADVMKEDELIYAQARYYVSNNEDGLNKNSLNEFLKQCKQRIEKSYIVLVWNVFESKDVLKLFQLSKGMKNKIIVITRMHTIPEECGRVFVERWPEEKLVKILKKFYYKRSTKRIQKELLELLDYNPYLVELLAKYHETRDRVQLCQMVKEIKKEGISEFLAQSKGKEYGVSCRYKENKNGLLSIGTYLEKCLYPYEDKDIQLMVELAIWTRKPIDLNFLKETGGIRSNQLIQAIDKGFLLYVDDKKQKVKMAAIYLWAINALKIELREDGKTEIIYDDRRIVSNENGIQTGLKLLKVMYKNEKCPTEHIEYFYEVIVSIIYRYQRVYSMKKGIKQSWKKSQYNLWTLFLEIVMELFREFGTVDKVMKIRGKIHNVYRRKEKISNKNEEQSVYMKWEELLVNIITGNMKKPELFEVAKLLILARDYKKLYPIVEAFIYSEIYELAMVFIDSCGNEIKKETSISAFLMYYFDNSAEIQHENVRIARGNINSEDEMFKYKNDIDVLCSIVLYYLKAMYIDRCLIADARIVANSIWEQTRVNPGSELWIKVQLYFLFFELVIDWNEGYTNPVYLCQKFEPVIQDIVQKLKIKSFSACTTSTAMIALLLADALVPSRLLRGEINQFVEELQSQNYGLFQKVADINKYQYQISDEAYQQLIEAIEKSMQKICSALNSYTFKENK